MSQWISQEPCPLIRDRFAEPQCAMADGPGAFQTLVAKIQEEGRCADA